MLPTFHFSIERWRKNEEYGVWVSNEGRVRLIKNKNFLEPRVNKSGYYIVFTEKGAMTIHRLVAYTWLGDKRNESYDIDHIDSNKRNNSVSNLRWVKSSINKEYAKFTASTVDEVYRTDTIDSAENFEDKLNIIYNYDVPSAAKVLQKLYENKQIYLYADEKVMPFEYPLIARDAKIGNLNGKEKFFPGVIKAMRTNAPYYGKYWSIKEVEE